MPNSKNSLIKILDPPSVNFVEDELKNPWSAYSIALRNQKATVISAEIFYKCQKALAYQQKLRLDRHERIKQADKLTDKEEQRVKMIYEQIAASRPMIILTNKEEKKYENILIAWAEYYDLRQDALKKYVTFHNAEVQQQQLEKQWRTRQNQQAEDFVSKIKLGVIVNDHGKIMGAIYDKDGNVDRSIETKKKICEACIAPTPNKVFIEVCNDAAKLGPQAMKQVANQLGLVKAIRAIGAVADSENPKEVVKVLNNNQALNHYLAEDHKKHVAKDEKEINKMVTGHNLVTSLRGELEEAQELVNAKVKELRSLLKTLPKLTPSHTKKPMMP